MIMYDLPANHRFECFLTVQAEYDVADPRELVIYIAILAQ